DLRLTTDDLRLTTILSSPERRRRRRRATMVSGLFVRIGEADERRLAPRPAEQLQPGRQRIAAGIAHRDRDRGKPGARREELAVVAARRVEIADEPRRIAPGGIREGVQP